MEVYTRLVEEKERERATERSEEKGFRDRTIAFIRYPAKLVGGGFFSLFDISLV